MPIILPPPPAPIIVTGSHTNCEPSKPLTKYDWLGAGVIVLVIILCIWLVEKFLKW